VLVYRVVSDDEIVFREELEELAREQGVTLHYVTGSHLDPGGARLLSAEHLRELIPDIAQREVYVCGPPAMSDLAQSNVRHAGVPGKYIHTESFAFSPSTRGWKGLGYLPVRVRVALLGTGIAALAAVVARLASVSASSTPAISAAGVVPTAKPTSAAVTRASAPTPAPTVSPTTVAATHPATAVPRPTAVPTSRPVSAQYAGPSVSTEYGSVQVSITVKSGTITGVAVSASPDSQRSQIIESQAIPTLKAETLQAQSASINTVSGATPFSNGYIQSLQGALTSAHIA
jgi:uncharacterized protein with FMN-binding domain